MEKISQFFTDLWTRFASWFEKLSSAGKVVFTSAVFGGVYSLTKYTPGMIKTIGKKTASKSKVR